MVPNQSTVVTPMNQRKQSKRRVQIKQGGAPCDLKLVKQLSVRLSLEEYQEVTAAAAAEGRTASNYLRWLLIERKAS